MRLFRNLDLRNTKKIFGKNVFDQVVIFFGFLPSSISPKYKGVTIIWAIGENTFVGGTENMVENFPGPPFQKPIGQGNTKISKYW